VSAVICVPPFEGLPFSLAMKDRAEVCPLSRRMMLRASGVSPRSTRIPAITVGPSLSPHSSTRTPVGSPCGVPTDGIGGVRAYPVPHMSHERGRPLLSAGSTMVHGRAQTTPCSPRLLSLLGRACQRLWLGRVYDVYQRFTCVGLAALPGSLAAWRSRLRLLLTDPPTVAGGTFPRSFAYRLTPAGRYQPLRPGREQLVEQLVSSGHLHLLVRQRTWATFRSHGQERDEREGRLAGGTDQREDFIDPSQKSGPAGDGAERCHEVSRETIE